MKLDVKLMKIYHFSENKEKKILENKYFTLLIIFRKDILIFHKKRLF